MALLRYVVSPGILEIRSNVKSFPFGFPVRLLEKSNAANGEPLCFVNFILTEEISCRSKGSSGDACRNPSYSTYEMAVLNLRPIIPFDLSFKLRIQRVNSVWTVYTNRFLWNTLKVPFRMRLDHLYSPTHMLIDTICVALIEKGKYLMHGGAFSEGNEGFIVMGIPGTGKSTTIINAVRSGFKFLGEENIITDGRKVYACPYSSSFIEIAPEYLDLSGNRDKVYIRLHHLVTKKFFPARLLLHRLTPRRICMENLDKQIEKSADISRLYFLQRGPPRIEKIFNDDALLAKVLHLNREEFPYFGNRWLLRYALEDSNFNIDEIMKKESTILREMLDNVEIFLCSAKKPYQYFKLIQRTL